MKDKNVAGILSLFLGWFGAQWFYLGKPGMGVLHLIFFWTPVVWIVSFIQAIIFFTMDPEKFDRKYNREAFEQPDYRRGAGADYDRRRYDRDRDRYERRERRQERTIVERPVRKTVRSSKADAFRKSGVEKFKDFDFEGAIADFQKVLEYDDKDVAMHFNLACAYSLTENAERAFHHLDRAVVLGFTDFQRIKTHDALAYLRIQDEFDTFERNGFRRPSAQPQAAPQEDLLSTTPDLLDQIKKLGEMKEQGLLTEEEFADRKKKLLS